MGAIYNERTKREIEVYQNDIDVHDLPSSAHYINNNFLLNEIRKNTSLSRFDELFYSTVELCESKYNVVKVLCIGSGNCDIEVNYAFNTPADVQFTCMDINPAMLDRGKRNAASLKIDFSRIKFLVEDVNTCCLPKDEYNIVFISQALHHFVELEHIFEEIKKTLVSDGYFIVNDIIGRNGHLIYENTFLLLNKLWQQLPYEFKLHNRQQQYFKNRIQWDCSTESFEGIRAEDILPLLCKNFNFQVFVPFYTIIQYFIDRDFGGNFDPDKSYDRAILEYVYNLDIYCLKNKLLAPTQMWGVLRLKEQDVTSHSYFLFDSPQEVLKIEHSDFPNILNELSSIPQNIQSLYEQPPRQKYNWNETLFFSAKLFNLKPFEYYGLHTPEESFCWTTDSFELILQVGECLSSNLILSIKYFVWEAIHGITLSINDFQLKLLDKNDFRKELCEVLIPKKIVEGQSSLKLSILCHGATSPNKIKAGKDVRLLGIALKSIVIKERM